MKNKILRTELIMWREQQVSDTVQFTCAIFIN